MSDNDRLAEIRARCEAATPGPWGYDGQHDEITADNPSVADYWLIVSQCRTAPDEAPSDKFGHQYSPDFAFIAHSREDVPYLLTEVERLRAENANLKRLLDDANERAAQIEDWQVKCALLEVDRDKARAENAALAGNAKLGQMVRGIELGWGVHHLLSGGWQMMGLPDSLFEDFESVATPEEAIGEDDAAEEPTDAT